MEFTFSLVPEACFVISIYSPLTEDVEAYSDLDLLIVTTGTAGSQLWKNLAWLEAVEPIVYRFGYNDDCYKVLFADSVFCELSILDASLLPTLQYSGGPHHLVPADF